MTSKWERPEDTNPLTAPGGPMSEFYHRKRESEPYTPGTGLSEGHRRMLYDESGISPEVVAERGYATITRREVPPEFKGYQRRNGLLIPVLSPDGVSHGWQLRADRPRKDKKGKPIKYDTPGGSRAILDVHPRMREEVR